jgi:electron transfer flavoprotein beta subunit
MHLAVILRLIPDLSEELEIDDSGTDIDRQWIGFKLNEFDDQALEEAVLLKERFGAKVTAIALAAEGSDRILQTAVARGADEALRIDHDEERVDSAAKAAYTGAHGRADARGCFRTACSHARRSARLAHGERREQRFRAGRQDRGPAGI